MCKCTETFHTLEGILVYGVLFICETYTAWPKAGHLVGPQYMFVESKEKTMSLRYYPLLVVTKLILFCKKQ